MVRRNYWKKPFWDMPVRLQTLAIILPNKANSTENVAYNFFRLMLR